MDLVDLYKLLNVLVNGFYLGDSLVNYPILYRRLKFNTIQNRVYIFLMKHKHGIGDFDSQAVIPTPEPLPSI